jgi:hypothetical protein
MSERWQMCYNVGGMVSCRLRATDLSTYRKLQAGGNASNTNNTAINYTTGYSQLIFKYYEKLCFNLGYK